MRCALSLSHVPVGGRALSFLLLCALVLAAQPARAALPGARDTIDATKTQAQKLFVRGMTRAYLGDYERAIRFYERALKLAPDEASILSAMADAHAAQEDLNSALFYAEQARNVAPENTHYHKQLAALHQRAGNTEEAIATYRELVGRFPTDVEARLDLAELLTEAQHTREAVAVYENVERLMGGATPRIYIQMLQLYRRLNDEKNVERVLRALVELRPDEQLFVHLLGQYYMKERQLDAAIELYEETLANNPEEIEIGLELTELYREQGRAQEADSLLEQLTNPEGASADQLVQRVRSLYHHDRPYDDEAERQAVHLLERAVELDPQHEEALHLLGELRYRRGRYAEAGTLLEQALEQNPRAPDRWTLAAVAYLRAEQLEQAVKLAEEGLLLFPGQLSLVRVAAHGLLQLGRNREAVERFETLRDLLTSADGASDEQRADVEATLGLLYTRLDDTSAADRAYERALALDPDHAMALNNYAYSLAERGRQLDRALEMARRAVELDPENASYLDTLGWVYFQREDYAAAERWIKQALDTGDASATVYEHYGDVQKALGNPSAARLFWQQALERDPGRDALREKLEALQREGAQQ